LWTMRSMKEMKGRFPMARKLCKVGAVILVWIAANLLGVAAIGPLISILPFLTSIPGLSIGLPIGFAQWIVLRRVAPISILWVLTISAGLLLGLVVINNSPIPAAIWGFLDDESVLSMTAFCTTVGLFVGSVQWLFLRGHFTKSLVWLLSSGVGLGLGIGLVLVTNLIDQNGIASIILVTLVYATATGLVMSWLSASHRKTESNLVNAT
jgi:hypothetical protein